MNDLHDLMYRASDGDPNRSTDPTALLRHGHRRVHRRRGLAAISGTAAASLAIVGGIAWIPSTTHDGSTSDGQPPVASGQTDPGAYEPVQVSRAQVGRRCTTVYHNAYGTNATLVVPPFSDGPWYEGRRAWVADPQDGMPGPVGAMTMSCEVPQADLVHDAGTVPSLATNPDDEAVRRDCGQFQGFDFAGLDVVKTNGSGIALAGVLRSTNGYVAECELTDAPGPQGDGSYVAIRREAPPATKPDERDYAVWFNVDQYAGDVQEGDYSIFGVGQIAGPDKATAITLTEPNGTVHEINVGDKGWYAIAEDMHLEMNPHGTAPITITVYGEDGSVLAKYADGEQVPCETSPGGC